MPPSKYFFTHWYVLRHGLVSMVALQFFFCACSKQGTISPSTTNSQVLLLTGSNGKYSKWQLNKLQINQVVQSSSSFNTSYQISYGLTGSFFDSDGTFGSWVMVNPDSLQQKITSATGTIVYQGFHISSLTATQLQLSYNVGSQKILTGYTAVK